MKKLFVAMVVVALAVVGQAATVSWTISNVQDAGGTKLTTGSVYVFFADPANAASEIAAIQALAGKGASALSSTLAGAAWNDTKKATAAGNFSIGTSAALGGYTLPTQESLGLTGNTAYKAYAVIFDTATVTDASKFIVTAAKDFNALDSASALNTGISFGTQAGNTSWASVKSGSDPATPEPTSGLLLLVGGAVLALRRRRA